MTEEVPNPAGGTHVAVVSYASQDMAVADAIVATPEKSRLTYGLAE
jgi:hypothetical protein